MRSEVCSEGMQGCVRMCSKGLWERVCTGGSVGEGL